MNNKAPKIVETKEDLVNGKLYKKAILIGDKLRIYKFIYLGPIMEDEINLVNFSYVPLKKINSSNSKGPKKESSYIELFNKSIIFKGFITDEELKEKLERL